MAVLSDGFWHRRFGGDPGIVGETVLLDERPFTVVGIMLLVAVAGGLVGLLLTGWVVGALPALTPSGAGGGDGVLPRIDAVAVDPAVVLFSLGLALVTGLAFGLLPALRASDLKLSAALALTRVGGGTGGGQRFGNRAGVVLVALVGVAAALAPARRASRVDPVTALRSE